MLRKRFEEQDAARRMNMETNSSASSSEEDSQSYFYVRQVTKLKINTTPRVTIMINGTPTCHVIDTGATMNKIFKTRFC